MNSKHSFLSLALPLLALALLLAGCASGTTGARTQPTATGTRSPGPMPTPENTPTVKGLIYIQMLDASNGWAITGQNHILRTSDGANHWQDVTPTSIDPPQVNGSPNLTYDFFSPSLAWVASYTRDNPEAPGEKTRLFRTTDGGQTWIRTDLQDIFGQIIFVNSEDGWMGVGEGGAAGSEGFGVYRTIDGGATWTKVAEAGPSTDNQPGALPFNGDKSGIGVRDASTAWVTGTQNGPSLFVWLYVTHDGGATWQQQTLPIPSSVKSQSYVQVVTNPPTFFNAQDGILPVQFEVGPNNSPNDVYVTHDGGASWQSTSLTSLDLLGINGLDFITVNQGWVTAGSTLSVTSDGGQHWTTLPSDPNFHDVGNLSFVSSEIGWAIDNPQVTPGSTTLLKTTDGGKTWAVVPFSNS